MKSILINDVEIDPSTCSFGHPWRRDSLCMSFNFPEIYINADDVVSINKLDEIETVIIVCPLVNYDFLKQFKNLQQLYIYKSSNLTSLSFLEDLVKLQLLYIRESELSNVDSIVNLLLRKEEKKKIASNLFERVSLELKGIAINSTKDIDVSAILNGNTKQINEIVINGKHIPKR